MPRNELVRFAIQFVMTSIKDPFYGSYTYIILLLQMESHGEKAKEAKIHLEEEVPKAIPKDAYTLLLEEFNFIKRPSEDFFCPVTFELLLEPHLTACCGNHLSVRAVNRLKSEEKPCPICKEPDLATMFDKFHRRRVRAVQVHCPHTPSGCEWVGEVGELSQHIQTCLKQHDTIS